MDSPSRRYGSNFKKNIGLLVNHTIHLGRTD